MLPTKYFFKNLVKLKTWYDHHGHPAIGMMRKIIANSIGHNLPIKIFPKSLDFVCAACATGNLIIKPSYLKFKNESLNFLERIKGDICGPIQPLSKPFRYFMVLIDVSTRWSHVCLLSTCNHALQN
jgi:hypothetical protein